MNENSKLREKGKRRCKTCQEIKDLDEFQITNYQNGRAYYKTECMDCLGVDKSIIEQHKLKKEGKKRCRECGEIKELNDFYRMTEKNGTDIYQSRCRECMNVDPLKIENTKLHKEGMRKCSVCGEIQSVDEFWGGSRKCKSCSQTDPVLAENIALRKEGKRRCRKCSVIKPFSEFHKMGVRDGLIQYRSICRECDSTDKLRLEGVRLAKKGKRRCRQCDTVKPFEEFWSRSTTCIVCSRTTDRAEQLERIRNGTKVCTMCEAELSLEEFPRASNGSVVSTCKDCTKKRKRIDQHTRRAKTSKADYTYDDIEALLNEQNCECYWCGCDVSEEYHVDHKIPISRGGKNTLDNLRITCPTCNQRKFDRTESEFVEYILNLHGVSTGQITLFGVTHDTETARNYIRQNRQGES